MNNIKHIEMVYKPILRNIMRMHNNVYGPIREINKIMRNNPHHVMPPILLKMSNAEISNWMMTMGRVVGLLNAHAIVQRAYLKDLNNARRKRNKSRA